MTADCTPASGGVLGPKEWVKLAWDFVRTPRFMPLDMTATNRSVLAFNLSFLFGEHELLRKCMTDILGCVRAWWSACGADPTLPTLF